MELNSEYNLLFEYVKKKDSDKFINLVEKLSSNFFFDINILDKSEKNLLFYAVLTNNIDLVDYLIEKEINLNIITNEGMNIINMAIVYFYDDILRKLLNINDRTIGVDLLNCRDKNNRTPIMFAISSKNMYAINLLIEKGANLNFYDKDKYNSVFYAIKTRNIDIFKKILSNMADINEQSISGENALHMVCSLQLYEMAELLINRDININIHEYSNETTPLHYAVILNNYKLTQLLLDNGANLNSQDMYGKTVLHYLIKEKNYNLFSLVGKFSKISDNIIFNLWDIEGEIPLHNYIVQNSGTLTEEYENSNKMMLFLINYSNLNIQNNSGNSCFHYIVKYKMWKIYKNILTKKKLDLFLMNSEKKYVFEYLDEKDDYNEFLNMIVESYIYILNNNRDILWTDKLDIECKITQEENAGKYEECVKKIKNKIILAIDEKKKFKESGCSDYKYYKCYDKSYPILKTPICIDVSEGKNLQFCTFTGSIFDVLFGLIFLYKKYKKDVCLVVGSSITKSDIYHNKKINQNYNYNGEFRSFELLWSNKKLTHDDFFIKKFQNCANNKKKKFVVIPIGIEMKEGSHAGYLVYDIKKKELERFETYGGVVTLLGVNYDSALLDEKIENKFKKIDPEIKYFKPIDFLPKISFHLFEIAEGKKKNKKIGEPAGYCALWCIWYIDNRLKYKNIGRKNLVNSLIQNIKSKNISFKNLIRNYAINIMKIRDSVLKKANLTINDWISEDITEKQFEIILNKINMLIN